MKDSRLSAAHRIEECLMSFLIACDEESARRIADAHPELREPHVIALLVDSATRERGSAAQMALARAALLCGSARKQPEALSLVTDLTTARAVADAARLEGKILDQVVKATRAAVDPRWTLALHPVLAGSLLDLASGILRRAYAATGSCDLLDEAVAAQRKAVQVLPEASPQRPRLLNNLGCRLAELHKTKGGLRVLEEAVAMQRLAVQVTPRDSVLHAMHLNNVALRLAELHNAVGNRRILDEAVTLQRQVVEATPEASPVYATHLNNLASHLLWMYEATADLRLLDEAIVVQRLAVRATPDASPDLPRRLGNLANHLAVAHKEILDARLLDEAVVTHRRAVQTASKMSTDWPFLVENLGNCLVDQYLATKQLHLLEEAVTIQRHAVQALPGASPQRPGLLTNLAAHLAGLTVATGDESFMNEAWALIANVTHGGPTVRAGLARMRARLVRLDKHRAQCYGTAAQELTMALDSFQDELNRPGQSLQDRRDLAHQADGLLGDLLTNYILDGQTRRAINLLEGNRMWLAAPGQRSQRSHEPPVAVAWVIAGQWETVVVSVIDHLDENALTVQVVEKTAHQIGKSVMAVLRAANSPNDGSMESVGRTANAQQEAAEALCDLANQIVAAFPPAERLLIVPLGVCAQVPYTAAKRPDGTFLIDRTTVTVAPSLAWARAAHRRRPNGRSIGSFHAGSQVNRSLDLRADRQTFKEIVKGEALDRPTAEQVLARFNSDTDIAHFSCHGAYNPLTPVESWLALETDLTIQAVLKHASGAPWLVNLSACETAVPDHRATEQHISFPTGFLLGGAAHILATLWPVGDAYASAVNRAFYSRIASNEHPADALRHALQHVRGTSPPSAAADLPRRPAASPRQPAAIPADHPYWWAPFTHYGSPW